MDLDLFFCLGGIEVEHDDTLTLFVSLKHFLRWIVVDKSPPVLCERMMVVCKGAVSAATKFHTVLHGLSHSPSDPQLK